MLKPGDAAPEFTLPDQHGEPFSLEASLAQRRARHLVYFYPKADTPGCTQQACGLRDVRDRIGDVVVVGISPDPVAKLARFDTKHSLGFPLLADTDHTTAEAYGVWKQKSMYGRTYMGIERSAFLIDASGRIEQAWYKVSPKATVSNLLAALGA
jgi:peroxiredoxin Q/BCP